MKNLLILINPYYQKDIIEQHLKLLIDNEKVAFGKIRSKLNTSDTYAESEYYGDVSEEKPLQLFLTDYSSIYVAKITKITNDDLSEIAPSYYKDNNLEVEQWFVITDMRELVRNNFEQVRDTYLSNFVTPCNGNHTYALYGNTYAYPLVVNMKNSIVYFDGDSETKYYPDIYQTDEFMSIKKNLIQFAFGETYVNHMHPDTMNNIISAEIEFQTNKMNPLYDFSSVVIKYSKTLEQEIYLFMKRLFGFLSTKNPRILEIAYEIQGYKYEVKDIFTHKPNLGTYKFLLKHELVYECLDLHCEKHFKFYVLKNIAYYITMIQDIRNETVHGAAPHFEDVEKLRSKIIGIASESILADLIKEQYKYLRA